MTLDAWLMEARQRLQAAGCPDAAVDAAWLLEDGLGLSRIEARLQRARALTAAEAERLEAMLARRAAGEPVQYVTGRADFMGYTFYVDSRVLIPRADTENLVEFAAECLRARYAEARRPLAVLDVCTGSGAIGLSLAKLCPFVRVTLADLSADALAVAARSAAALGADAALVQGDLFAPVAGHAFDMIACNPPYIPRGDLDGLQREVRREPRLALDGGTDGLDFYRRIAAEADALLAPGGSIVLEVGIHQADMVRQMLADSPIAPNATGIRKDLQGIDRVVWAQK